MSKWYFTSSSTSSTDCKQLYCYMVSSTRFNQCKIINQTVYISAFSLSNTNTAMTSTPLPATSLYIYDDISPYYSPPLERASSIKSAPASKN